MKNYNEMDNKVLDEFLFYGDVEEVYVLEYSEAGCRVAANINGKKAAFPLSFEKFNELQDVYDIRVNYSRLRA